MLHRGGYQTKILHAVNDDRPEHHAHLQPPAWRGWVRHPGADRWQEVAVGMSYGETMGATMAACGGLFADKLVRPAHIDPNRQEGV